MQAAAMVIFWDLSNALNRLSCLTSDREAERLRNEALELGKELLALSDEASPQE